MRLFFDQNLSHRLCDRLVDVFPHSVQARMANLERATDADIWQFAKDNGLTIVTQDSDFADLSATRGAPPKVIWLRCGNLPTEEMERLIRKHIEPILAFEQDESADCIELL